MTLLVVGIGVPALQDGGDEGELLGELGDLVPELVSFFLSFAVIGRYRVAHHEFFARLLAVDTRLIAIDLVYLAFVAFLPFPTALLGNYFENPISVARRLPVGRGGVLRTVTFFLASIRVAFVNTVAAVAVWFLSLPAQALWFDRRKPPGTDELLQGVEAAGTAPASAEHPPDACYERSRGV